MIPNGQKAVDTAGVHPVGYRAMFGSPGTCLGMDVTFGTPFPGLSLPRLFAQPVTSPSTPWWISRCSNQPHMDCMPMTWI